MRARALIFALLAVVGCRLNPDCFGQNECGRGLVCSQGECVHPSLLLAEAGVDGIDAGSTATWCEVQPIVLQRCLPCHANPPLTGVPRALVAYGDTQQIGPGGAAVYDLMATRMNSTIAPMPPATAPSATPQEIATVVSWAGASAPDCNASMRDGGFGVPRDGGGVVVRDSGPARDGGPPRDAGPSRDGGPFNPLDYITNVRQIGVGTPLSNVAGLVWLPETQVMLFADPGRDIVQQATPPAHMFAAFRANSDNTNGMVIDPNGDLVVTEIAGRRIARRQGGNYVTVLDTYQGNRLNSPNDVIFRSDGAMYFSDPPYGLAAPSDREIPFNGLYSYVPTATTAQLVAEYEGDAVNEYPSGLAISPDELTLYQTDVQTGDLVAWDIRPNGRLTNRRIFANVAPPVDGVAVDTWGNVYFGTSNGVIVYEPDGTELGNIDGLPALVNRVGFGGADRRTLYVTAGNAIFALDAAVAGIR